jgi:hypothetical protein
LLLRDASGVEFLLKNAEDQTVTSTAPRDIVERPQQPLESLEPPKASITSHEAVNPRIAQTTSSPTELKLTPQEVAQAKSDIKSK